MGGNKGLWATHKWWAAPLLGVVVFAGITYGALRMTNAWTPQPVMPKNIAEFRADAAKPAEHPDKHKLFNGWTSAAKDKLATKAFGKIKNKAAVETHCKLDGNKDKGYCEEIVDTSKNTEFLTWTDAEDDAKFKTWKNTRAAAIKAQLKGVIPDNHASLTAAVNTKIGTKLVADNQSWQNTKARGTLLTLGGIGGYIGSYFSGDAKKPKLPNNGNDGRQKPNLNKKRPGKGNAGNGNPDPNANTNNGDENKDGNGDDKPSKAWIWILIIAAVVIGVGIAVYCMFFADKPDDEFDEEIGGELGDEL